MSLKDDHLMHKGVKLAILKINIVANLDKAMILDNEPTKEIGMDTTVRITKNMGMVNSLMEVDITKEDSMTRVKLSIKMQHQRWHILL